MPLLLHMHTSKRTKTINHRVGRRRGCLYERSSTCRILKNMCQTHTYGTMTIGCNDDYCSCGDLIRRSNYTYIFVHLVCVKPNMPTATDVNEAICIMARRTIHSPALSICPGGGGCCTLVGCVLADQMPCFRLFVIVRASDMHFVVFVRSLSGLRFYLYKSERCDTETKACHHPRPPRKVIRLRFWQW